MVRQPRRRNGNEGIEYIGERKGMVDMDRCERSVLVVEDIK